MLVVEDDNGLRDLLARGLRAHDFEVVTAVDGASAVRSVDPPPDAIVLDIGLPDADGRDVCQALRARGIDAPVIFLSARRDVTDRLAGFASGGDDYLAKPFAFPELVARLHALVRRHVHQSVDDEPIACGWTRSGTASATATAVVDLSPIEYRLMARLLAEPERGRPAPATARGGVAGRRHRLGQHARPVPEQAAPQAGRARRAARDPLGPRRRLPGRGTRVRRRAAPDRRTLRGRVSLLAVGVIAGWLVVLAAGFDVCSFSRLDRQVDDALRVRAQAASATWS